MPTQIPTQAKTTFSNEQLLHMDQMPTLAGTTIPKNNSLLFGSNFHSRRDCLFRGVPRTFEAGPTSTPCADSGLLKWRTFHWLQKDRCIYGCNAQVSLSARRESLSSCATLKRDTADAGKMHCRHNSSSQDWRRHALALFSQSPSTARTGTSTRPSAPVCDGLGGGKMRFATDAVAACAAEALRRCSPQVQVLPPLQELVWCILHSCDVHHDWRSCCVNREERCVGAHRRCKCCHHCKSWCGVSPLV